MINWEDEINGMNLDELPERGLNAPDLEKFSIGPNAEQRGSMQKVTTDIYIFESKETGKTYTSQTVRLREWEDLSFLEYLAVVKRDREEAKLDN